ncbi:MAG TPA: DUF167 domain-containing protein [Patescibacteria group bacterium]|nr:DUF167 domain-containing protein [Patescibacteria group bacterium]
MPDIIVEVQVRAGARERSLAADGAGGIKIKTPVAPEKGKANKDVVDMLAEHFKVPKSCVILLRGETSSKKRFKIMA